MNRFESQLSTAEPAFTELLQRVPLQQGSPLPPDWLRCEVLERYQVLRHAALAPGSTILEVGSGSHAITTMPLAFSVGQDGRVVAAERSRWTRFLEIIRACEL